MKKCYTSKEFLFKVHLLESLVDFDIFGGLKNELFVIFAEISILFGFFHRFLLVWISENDKLNFKKDNKNIIIFGVRFWVFE